MLGNMRDVASFVVVIVPDDMKIAHVANFPSPFTIAFYCDMAKECDSDSPLEFLACDNLDFSSGGTDRKPMTGEFSGKAD